MANPHIVTFESDIENEIRSKSASLTDIAASSGVVENRPEKSALSWLILVVIALVILASGVGAYFYYVKQANKSARDVMIQDKNYKTVEVFGVGGEATTTTKTTTGTNPSNTPTVLTRKVAVKEPLDTLFPSIFPYVGKNFIKVETASTGYIITFSRYNEVYKGILDNEDLFVKDVLALYGDTSKNAPLISDIQIGSVDARTGASDGGKKIFYAFIRPSIIIIGDSKETIISISNAILK